LSDEDASSEDNALDTDNESLLSFEEGQAREFVENMNYHKEMRKMRKELVGDVSDLE